MTSSIDPLSLVMVPLAMSQEMVALVITEQAFWAEQFTSMWASAIDQDRFGQVTTYDPAAVGPPPGATAAVMSASQHTAIADAPGPQWAYVQWVESTSGMVLLTSYLTGIGASWAFAWDEEIAAWAVWSNANVVPVDDPPGDGTVVPLHRV